MVWGERCSKEESEQYHFALHQAAYKGSVNISKWDEVAAALMGIHAIEALDLDPLPFQRSTYQNKADLDQLFKVCTWTARNNISIGNAAALKLLELHVLDRKRWAQVKEEIIWDKLLYAVTEVANTDKWEAEGMSIFEAIGKKLLELEDVIGRVFHGIHKMPLPSKDDVFLTPMYGVDRPELQKPVLSNKNIFLTPVGGVIRPEPRKPVLSYKEVFLSPMEHAYSSVLRLV